MKFLLYRLFEQLTARTVNVAAEVMSMSVALAAVILDTLDLPPSTIVAL